MYGCLRGRPALKEQNLGDSKKEKVTIDDIARICGVSRGTVNRAIHDKPEISQSTKEKVLRVVDELGYRPSYHATTLRTGRTHTIAVVLPGAEAGFFSRLYSEIENIVRQKGYLVALVLSHNDPEREAESLRIVAHRRLDGLIIFPVNKETGPIKSVLKNRIPTVILLNRMESVETNLLHVDDYGGVREIVQHLIIHGHKRIAYVDSTHEFPSYNDYVQRERYRAYRDGMKASGLVVPSEYYVPSKPAEREAGDYSRLEPLAACNPVPTAVVCFHDRVALWTIQGLLHLGFRIPEDMSITGFDQAYDHSGLSMTVTTTAIPTSAIAAGAVAMLMNDIGSGSISVREERLSVRFVPGQTSKKLV